MLNLFRSKSVFAQLLVILILLISLFYLMPFYPIQKAFSYSPLYEVFYEVLIDRIIIQKVILYTLVFSSGIVLSLLLQFYRFINQYNYLPTLIFLSLFGAFPFLMQINQITLSSILILWILIRMNKLETNENYKTQLVSLSFITSVFSLIYLPNIIFLLLIVVGLIIFSKFSFSELFIMLFSAISPFLYIFSYYYITDNLPEQWNEFAKSISFGDISITILQTEFFLYKIIVLVFLSIIVYFRLLSDVNAKLIGIRRKVFLISWLILVLLAYSFFTVNLFDYVLYLFLIPISIMMAYFLSSIKRTKLPNIIMIGFLLLIILELIFAKSGFYVN